MKLDERPRNANKLSEDLDLDYKTIRHHLDLMKDHNVVVEMGEGYGKNYFLSDQMNSNMDKLKEIAQKSGVRDEN